MPRDKEAEREYKLRTPEQTVVEYIYGTYIPPKEIAPLVERYNLLRKVVDECESYPRGIDSMMNKLFDAMVVMAS